MRWFNSRIRKTSVNRFVEQTKRQRRESRFFPDWAQIRKWTSSCFSSALKTPAFPSTNPLVFRSSFCHLVSFTLFGKSPVSRRYRKEITYYTYKYEEILPAFPEGKTRILEKRPSVFQPESFSTSGSFFFFFFYFVPYPARFLFPKIFKLFIFVSPSLYFYSFRLHDQSSRFLSFHSRLRTGGISLTRFAILQKIFDKRDPDPSGFKNNSSSLYIRLEKDLCT